ncbi:MAG TPA: amidohydrolase family protein [Longimicrobium sp.]
MRTPAVPVLLACTLLATRAPAQGPLSPPPVAITHVTVVDPAGGVPLRDVTVITEGGRIRQISPAAGVEIPTGALVVNGAGRYLIAGLWDMHVHLAAAGESVLPVLVSQGVLGVRDMGGGFEQVRAWRSRVEAGESVGPRIRTAGPIVENAAWLARLQRIPVAAEFIASQPRVGVSTVGEARRAVDSLAALGVDFVKVRNAPPWAVYSALVRHAHERGLTVVGHTPEGGIGLRGALRAGQHTIEHIDVLARELNPLSPAERGQLFALMIRDHVGYTPTLVAEMTRIVRRDQVAAVVADSLGLRDPRRRRLSPELLSYWRLQQRLDAYDTQKDWRAQIESALGHLRAMNRAGVTMLAGTDLGARLVYPGSSLHDELALLVEHAGLSPLDALRAATRNAAESLGLGECCGSVEVGKAADLVLLDADPLQDIRNTRRIHAVVRGGKLYSRPALDSLTRGETR